MILTLRTICHYRALGFSLLVQPLRQGQASDATDNYVKLITRPSRLVTMTRGSRSIVPMLSFDAEGANLNVSDQLVFQNVKTKNEKRKKKRENPELITIAELHCTSRPPKVTQD